MGKETTKPKRTKAGYRPINFWISEEGYDMAINASGKLTIAQKEKVTITDALNYLIQKGYESLNQDDSFKSVA
jgi:hypothetical protein